MTVRIAVLLVALVLIVGIAGGCSGGGGGVSGPTLPDLSGATATIPTSPASTETGMLEGTLMDNKSASPASGMSKAPAPFASAAFTLTIANNAYDFTTDANGFFRVEGIPVGNATYSIFNDVYYKEGTADIAAGQSASLGAVAVPKVELASPSGSCKFSLTAYGFTGNNSYSEYVTAYVYKIRWDNLRAPSYGDYQWLSGSDTSGYATFSGIPVPSSQIYKYKCTITYLVKYYDSGTGTYSDGKSLEVKRYANIYPSDTGKWLSGSTWLRSYEIRSRSYY